VENLFKNKQDLQDSKVDDNHIDKSINQNQNKSDTKLLSKFDYIISVLPHTAENHKLIDKKWFSEMNNESVFMNIGRGSTVNEADLLESLEDEHRGLRAAWLDVT